MSQVSLLSVDVGQNRDMHGAKGDAPIRSQAKSSAFSDAMEQHYSSKKDTESDGKVKQDGNQVLKAATSPHQDNSSNGSIKPAKVKKTDGDHTLPVLLSKDDKSLTGKVTGSDDAHTLPLPLPTDDESLVTQSTASYGAHTLTVPIAFVEEQLALVKKSKNGEHTLPVPAPISPLAAATSAIEQAEGALSGDPKVVSNQQNLSLDFQSQIPQTGKGSTNNLAQDDAVDLLKMLNGAQQLLTKPASISSDTESGSKNTQLATEQILSSNKGAVQSLRPNTEATAQGELIKTANAEQVPKSAIVSDAPQTKLGGGNNIVADQFTENSIANVGKNSIERAALNIAESNASLDAKDITAAQTAAQDAKQVAGSREMHTTLVSESELASAKKILAAELNTENNALAGEKNDAKVSQAAVTPSSVAEFQRASDKDQPQTRTINQSTASVIASSIADSKLDVNSKTALTDDVSKFASSVFEAEKLGKNDSEQQALQSEKIASAFNQTLDAQAAKPTVSPGELAAKQEQSFESAITTLSANTVQTQKSITAMNTETIAIYRKDFADAVKDKVMVMINQKIQQVEIQLDPPEMGNIHVRVNLQNEQAAVQFVVQNQQAKDALEQNMGKLRDMLAESGVDVGDASIEQRQAQEQNSNGFDGQTNNGEHAESGEGQSNENDKSVLNVVKASSTGVDYYA